jgi:hypothetical protein
VETEINNSIPEIRRILVAANSIAEHRRDRSRADAAGWSGGTLDS